MIGLSIILGAMIISGAVNEKYTDELASERFFLLLILFFFLAGIFG